MANPELQITLDDAVAEVLGDLTGQTLTYLPESDRYYAIVRQINKALRLVATEVEWSYYASTEDVGLAHVNERIVNLRPAIRPRIQVDDSVRLCNDDGYPLVWAHFYPREAIHKVPDRSQLWVAHQRSSLEFSRPFMTGEDGLHIMVPVMREPIMFRLPARPEDPSVEEMPLVPQELREQLVDFEWPDLVVAKALYLYAQTDPMFQPRVQTLEANYQDLMYALRDRDTKNTDSPFMNPFDVPIEGNIFGGGTPSHRPYGEQARWRF